MYQQPYQSSADIEAEMNRFEKEVLSTSASIAMPAVAPAAPAFAVHFIPPQLQRQQQQNRNNQQQASMGTFVPATAHHTVSAHQPAVGSFGGQVSYTVTPMSVPTAVHTLDASLAGSSSGNDDRKKHKKHDKGNKQKKLLRIAGGQVWEDPTLSEWDADDFRIFCGDLGNDVGDDVLARAFNRFPSFVKAKVVRDKRSNKSKGYGFVSFKDPQDFARAIREMNGKYVGSRPIKLRKSSWKERNLDVVKRKFKQKQKLGLV